MRLAPCPPLNVFPLGTVPGDDGLTVCASCCRKAPDCEAVITKRTPCELRAEAQCGQCRARNGLPLLTGRV